MGPRRRGAMVGSWQGRRECPYQLIRARLRTPPGAVQRGPAAQCFIVKGALTPKLPPAVQVPWHSVGTMLRLERHPFGPRVYFLRRRIHEYHLGLAVLLGLAVGAFFGLDDLGLATGLAAVAGLWLVAKDWRDLVSAATPNSGWRHRFLLRNVESLDEIRVFHALALPAAAALIVTAFYLYRR